MGNFRCRSRGFTLVELVVTLIVLGILAAAVIPRFANPVGFNSRGFSDEARAALQYARKVAVASRRNTCVTQAGNTLSLTMAGQPGLTQVCDQAILQPQNGAAYQITAPSGVSLSTPFGVAFDGQGRALAAAALTVSGDGSYVVTVEAGTGHVH